jgi:alkylhydroperoxidase family enzyme
VPAAERAALLDEALADAAPGFKADTNIFATLLHHPSLARDYRRFGDNLRTGLLPIRDRELLILRTAWNCRSAYEWGQHGNIALTAGLTPAEVAAVAAYPDSGPWSPVDTALLSAADELHVHACITDPTWETLSNRYDARQLIEVTMLVGNYHLLAFVMNSLGISPESDAAPLPPDKR